MRKVDTVRFGEIEVEEEKVVHFEQGIPAFEEETEFLIIPYEEESPYVFLQSLKTPQLAFLMTSPFVFFQDYEIEIDDGTLEKLSIKSQDDIALYVILTIPGGSVKNMTANLMAPIVVNTANMQARQVVLDKGNYTTKHRLFTDKKEGE
ncbi:MAG: flagellar assembly protein FliW [Selenomonadaceae bacterium]|nr:flagellar assembly protein FliW [Selenomonadaceae bacterium]